MQRAALLAAAALLAGCQTIGQSTGDAPATAEPVQPPATGAPAGGLSTVSPTAGNYRTTNTTRAAPTLPAPVPAPETATAPETTPAAPATETKTAQAEAAISSEQQPEPAPAALPPASPPVSPPARPVPHIYLALQSGGAGQPVSAVFAIDAARDNTPSDDPAVRLTPSNGLCNPQEMRSYDFAPEDATSPVVSEAQQAQGLTARDLPAFMAVSVTDRMLSLGLASDREQTRALNVCTRKLWERLLAGN